MGTPPGPIEVTGRPATLHDTPSRIPLPFGPNGNPYTYHAFLSHASADRETANRLYRSLREEGLEIFLDTEAIKWGDSIRRAIDHGIHQSRHVIVCLSQACVESDWAEYEALVSGVDDPANRRLRILPLLVEDLSRHEIPARYRAIKHLAYRTGVERDLALPTIVQALRGDGATSPSVDDTPFTQFGQPDGPLVLNYRAFILREHGYFILPGIDDEVSYKFLLAQTYVSLRGSPFDPERRLQLGSQAEFLEQAKAQNETLEVRPLEQAFELTCSTRYANAKGIVIVGDPGSGKTTVLKQLLLTCAERGSRALGLEPGLLPIWLPLRELEDTNTSIDAFVRQQLGRNPHLRGLEAVGEHLIARGRLLLLLDVLDEVATEARRDEVCEWIQMADDQPDWYIAVSTRYAGWRSGNLGTGFVEFHVRAMELDHARGFIQRWFEAMLARREADLQRALVKARRVAEDLWLQLKEERPSSRLLKRIMGNPLLLANLCRVHHRQGELPHGRADLYERCTRLLLDVWRKVELPVDLDLEDARRLLEPLAWELTQRGLLVASETDIIEWLLSRQADDHWHRPKLSHAQAQRFLRAIRDQSGLLVGWSQSRYGFLHKSFQEHLAAREIVRRNGLPSVAIRVRQYRMVKLV